MDKTNNTAATISAISSSHTDLSRQYDCRASMTVVTFMLCGVVHRARRFVRADVPTTGQIELYTCEPYAGEYTTCTELGWYSSAHSEDFLRYVAANPTSRVDRLATILVENATTGDMVRDDQSARYAMVEL